MVCFLFPAIAFSQAGDKDLSPDFTATDINGISYNLYELLDEGKMVILDYIGINCGPCWRDHESGKLKNFYNEFGPAGTDEVVVFMVESNPNTDIADLMGENGVGLGDWVTDTPYPILNDHKIRPFYHVIGYPTYYKICPNRKIEQIFVGLMEQEDFPPLLNACAPLAGNDNLGLHDFYNLEKIQCGNITTTDLNVILQNKGENKITSTLLQLFINGEPNVTQLWTGELEPYYFDYLSFDDAPLSGITNFEVRVMEVNEQEDDVASDNSIVTEFKRSESTEYQQLIIHLDTDEKGKETYWQLWTTDGDLIEIKFAGDYEANSDYYELVTLPEQACYDFILYDSAADGLGTNGKVTIYDIEGKVLGEIGPGLGFFETRKLELVSNLVKNASASIIDLKNVPEYFCEREMVAPVFQLMNTGEESLTYASIDVLLNRESIFSSVFDGTLEKGESYEINVPPMLIEEDSELIVTIDNFNQQGTTSNFRNRVSRNLKKLEAEETLILDLLTDDYACEIYWQFTSENSGDILASGGNPNVTPGPNLEAAVQHVTCSDAYYENNQSYQISIPIPSDDCYVFEIVDNYGDGLSFGGSWSLSNFDGQILIEGDREFSSLSYSISGEELVSVKNQNVATELTISPNPTHGKVKINNLKELHWNTTVEVFHSSGRMIERFLMTTIDLSSTQAEFDFSGYGNGVYFVKLSNGDEVFVGKFVVSN